MRTELKHLLRLLDDESEQSASLAMAELLASEDGSLDKLLRRLQEAKDPKLRRRVHQLQSVITLRRRRRLLGRKLEARSLGLLEGLVGMHLLWYDNDSPESVYKQWAELMEESKKFRPVSLERLAYFMRKKGFACPGKDDVEADYFCLGTVMDESIGADFMLCSMGRLIAAAWGLKLNMTQLAGDFILIDGEGQALHPSNDWKIIPKLRKSNYKDWDVQMTLNLVGAMLFLCAVNSDSFRYVYTVGSCLSKSFGGRSLDFLPYPYATKADAVKG